jgi:hypothetical protein
MRSSSSRERGGVNERKLAPDSRTRRRISSKTGSPAEIMEKGMADRPCGRRKTKNRERIMERRIVFLNTNLPTMAGIYH